MFIFKQNKNLHFPQLTTLVDLVDRGDLNNLKLNFLSFGNRN
nr:MAG TPA: hypothetical protein [Caudoviricetes sp.]